ncbi:hypothetical protein llap_16468 [Limosa lapponica baueri]|uniref:Uncharacterized protein n=1 Tax=Limosa lapponica baueri TaxID=1758121 RepID=A0A2I0THF5_LIMLA|nr:hypothetical protein llap_16468 [Limosa lapponica baueri]
MKDWQVHFPDVERVEWLNKVLVQAWPYFGTIMEKTFKEVVEPKIRAKNVHLKTCTFTKIHFGEKCPRINGIKAYTKEIDRRQIILDLQICYIGDCEIHMDISKFNLGVKGVQLYGTLRVILEPLLTDAPFIGAVTLFFLQKPHLEINWAGISNLLDVPGIKEKKFVVHEVPGQDLEVDLYDEDPDKDDFMGSLLISLVDVMNDRTVDEKTEREPSSFALLTVGNKTQKSKTCNFSKDPTWGQAFTFFVHSAHSQSLHVEIKDKDRDSALGTSVVCLSHVLKDPSMTLDQRFQLDHSSSDSFIKMKLVLRALNIEEPDPQRVKAGVNASKQGPVCAMEKGGNQQKFASPPKPEASKVPPASKDSAAVESLPKKDSREDLDTNDSSAAPVPSETVAGLNETERDQKAEHHPSFEFFESLENVKKRTLDIAVKNSRPFISQERKELGKVRIDLSQEDLIKGFAQW